MEYIKGSEAIYVRQSVDKKDSLSIEGQIAKCKLQAYYPDDLTVYSDKGFSGKNTNRPEFLRLLADIKKGIIKRVIVYKLDRLSRSTLDFGILMNTFTEQKVDFVSISETFDTSTPIGKAMLQIVMVFAELERNTIQGRITDNYYERGKRGLFLGGPAPFGFKNVKEIGSDGKKFSNLELNLTEAEIVSQIYTSYLSTDKISLGKISNTLNAKKIPSPKGTKWDSSKISRILRNPSYVMADANVYSYFKTKKITVTSEIGDFSGEYACYLYGKREANERKYTNLENHFLSISRHKGFVPADVWLACQRKLDANSQIKNSGKGSHSWLSGLVKCGKCSYGMTVSRYKNYRYFVCRGKHNLKNCTGQSITQYADEIEQYISKEIEKKLANLPKITQTTKPINFIANNKIAMEIVKIDEKMRNIINSIALLDGKSVNILGEELNRLAKEKETLEEEIIKNQKIQFVDDPFERVISLAKNFDNATFDEKKLIAKTLISKIHIDDMKITVSWVV